MEVLKEGSAENEDVEDEGWCLSLSVSLYLNNTVQQRFSSTLAAFENRTSSPFLLSTFFSYSLSLTLSLSQSSPLTLPHIPTHTLKLYPDDDEDAEAFYR